MVLDSRIPKVKVHYRFKNFTTRKKMFLIIKVIW